MAKLKGSSLLQGYHGKLGNLFIIKSHGKNNYLSAIPKISKKEPTELQKVVQARFIEAVAYAKTIVNDPVLKANFKAAPGLSVYTTAIKKYYKTL